MVPEKAMSTLGFGLSSDHFGDVMAALGSIPEIAHDAVVRPLVAVANRRARTTAVGSSNLLRLGCGAAHYAWTFDAVAL
jgi:hypothetical protein